MHQTIEFYMTFYPLSEKSLASHKKSELFFFLMFYKWFHAYIFQRIHQNMFAIVLLHGDSNVL